jgi:capsular exopolysaccharide synthesis family protein
MNVEIKQYWNLVLKNLSLVLILAFIGATVGLLVSFSSPKIYRTGSQIFISTPTPTIDIGSLQQGSSFAQQRVISYARVISGPATLVPVIQELGLKMSASELAQKISSSAPLGTVLINIQVTDASPIRAAAIANAVAIQFGKTIETLELPQFGDSSGVKSTMVRSAEIPSSPSSPNTKLNILTGLLIGFIIASLIGVVRQIFDSTVKNATHLSGYPLLSTIMFDLDAEENPLINQIGNYSIRAESFRHLRTALKLPKSENECEVIAITSAFPGEGKTVTSINLATSFAQTGLKVALVEADLRRPSFKKYFNSTTSKNIGLTNLLDLIESNKAKKSFESYFEVFGANSDSIEWLSSGDIPPNPAEKLGTSYMRRLIAGLKAEYDIVILDTPPALPVTDAAVISSVVDSVIVVARAGVTKQAHLHGVFEVLENMGAKIAGVVINMVPPNTRGEEYGYAYNRYDPKTKYGYKYGYGYGYGYGKSEPYGPLVLQSNEPATGEMRVPLDVRLRNKIINRKARKNKSVNHIQAFEESLWLHDAEVSASLKKSKKPAKVRKLRKLKSSKMIKEDNLSDFDSILNEILKK